MPRYIRAIVPGGTFFFTVAILDRRRRLLIDHIESLRAAFAAVMTRRPLRMDAVVILPDHLHCVWTLPPGDSDFSMRWHAIKSAFSRTIPQGERLSARRIAKGERGIWQRRFWEHAIRDEDDLARHVDYIHYNPVKHGHATCAADWSHSSFQQYVERGVYAPDWGANDVVKKLDWQ